MLKTHIFFKGSFLLLSLFLTNMLLAQAPAWTKYDERQSMYPKSRYVIGFNSERNVPEADADAALDRLLDYARLELVESINVTIKSVGTINITNVNSKTHEYFKKTSASYSKVNLTGLQVDTYYDKRKKEAFAFAFADKQKLVEAYKITLNKNAEAIKRKVATAEEFIAAGDNQNALKHYFETLPMFREFEEGFTVIVALDPAKLAELDQAITSIDELKNGVNQGVAQLQKGETLTLDDVAYMMAKGYHLQLKKPEQTVKLANFTYQDTKMASPLSKRWTSLFEKKLVDVADFPVTTGGTSSFYQGGNPYTENTQKEVKYVITGTFWEEGDKLKFISIFRELESGKALASMESTMMLSWLEQNQIGVKPQNFEEAYSNLKVFSRDEIVGGGLMIDSWTNKGDENLIFTEGETMKVYARVNKPCYLRFIYHTADGQRVLLLDNYYIDQSKVNKVYEIPEEFTCTEPFGVETLQINARTEPFEALHTSSQYGYDFIVDNLEEVVANTRGFKKTKNAKVLTAEKRVMITTMTE
ncbi:DUF4384 domain-containing protein [Flammeovirgaceae bacterium SG7u.111]|nr:DUF4384 domain-containing protein [Flammeovirgaceae bacterium SG7u.132]WPO34597.1 DUF4384 domain-containing protein [Flammeovirgaceae bacterium SG7u.111]